MKRKLTESQAATEQRRAAFRVIVKQVADMTDSERAALANRTMITTCEQHTLSMGNQILTMVQFPAATIIGGFNQWHSAGRSVRKGEHSQIYIWIPGKGKKVEPGTEPTSADDVRFFMQAMFDISQTEALPA